MSLGGSYSKETSFYDQIDGVVMGSPLAPFLANLFMGHHEKLWFEKFSRL